MWMTCLVTATRLKVGDAASEGGGWEFPVFWTVALVAQALLGDGAFALRTSGNSDPVGKLAGAYSR